MIVRRYLLVAAAAAAIATPAMARDHSGYVGIDAGVMWAKSSAHIDATDSYYCDYYSSYYRQLQLRHRLEAQDGL